MDETSDQLNSDLLQSVARSLSARRPLLHHLNADTSWLLQLPRPLHSVRHSGRYWFNILIDPWLSGSQSDVASWFSQQWHEAPPAVGSIHDLEALARDIEILSARSAWTDTIFNGRAKGAKGARVGGVNIHLGETLIDAIAISHEFTDHCHKETLLQCNSDIPVLATTSAAQTIKSWSHFRSVLEVPVFGGSGSDLDWRSISIAPLPEWVGIGRLMSKKDALYYHSAIVVAFAAPEARPPTKPSSLHYRDSVDSLLDAPAEAVIYTPHGIQASDLRSILQASPPIKTLALLHGLHDIAVPMAQLNLGAHNGLRAHRLLHPRYWIGTHDAQKVGGGLVAWFLKRKTIPLEEALKSERLRKLADDDDWENHGSDAANNVSFIELQNGECVMLE